MLKQNARLLEFLPSLPCSFMYFGVCHKKAELHASIVTLWCHVWACCQTARDMGTHRLLDDDPVQAGIDKRSPPPCFFMSANF